MSWDIGVTGSCAHCGAHIHVSYEDRAWVNPVWVRCPQCGVADTRTTSGEEAEFWKEPPPCSKCGTALVPWNSGLCPRCGKDVELESFQHPN